VNDGSTDNTLEIIRKIKGIKIINLKRNHGKGYAIINGVKNSLSNIVVFIDADLSGFNDVHIFKLIYPLISGKYDVAIGYPIYNNLDHLCRPLSGERAYFKKDLLPHLNKLKTKGYGIELYLNFAFKNKRTKLFPLRGVRITPKHEKQSYETVLKLTLIQSFDVLSEVFRQKNPVFYLLKSYLYPFYIKEPKKINTQIKIYIDRIKKNFLWLDDQ
jgi:glycosyltransferase involved in cell wall biosynthesis